MYLGRFQLGDTINFQVVTTDGATPTLPDDCPVLKIWDASALVLATEVPSVDRYLMAGIFCLPLFLGHQFSAGYHSYAFYYNVSSWNGLETGTFQILPGGNKDGAITSMYFMERPQASYVIQQLQSGKIKKGRNPSL